MRSAVMFAAVAVCFVAAVPASHAAPTVSEPFEVTATVEPYCAIVANTGLDFGSYTAENVNGSLGLEVSNVISVICPLGMPYTIGLDNGLNGIPTTCGSGEPVDRNMTSVNESGGNLAYQLYTDGNRTIVWGCTPETDVEAIGTNTVQQYSVNGLIAPGIITVADDYADTVTLTVNF